MKLLTPSQSRAARGLLNWTQPDLADHCDIHVQTISHFEQGIGSPTKRTLQIIITALETAGIEFMEGEGVRKKQPHIKIFQGQQDFCSFFDDVYDTCKKHPSPNVCITNVREVDFDKWLAEYESVHAARMIRLKKDKLRVLVKENDNYLTSVDYCEYRWIKETHFADTVLYLYGDKSAFIQFSKNDVVVTLVESKEVTESMRKMFDTVWNNSKEIDIAPTKNP